MKKIIHKIIPGVLTVSMLQSVPAGVLATEQTEPAESSVTAAELVTEETSETEEEETETSEEETETSEEETETSEEESETSLEESGSSSESAADSAAESSSAAESDGETQPSSVTTETETSLETESSAESESPAASESSSSEADPGESSESTVETTATAEGTSEIEEGTSEIPDETAESAEETSATTEETSESAEETSGTAEETSESIEETETPEESAEETVEESAEEETSEESTEEETSEESAEESVEESTEEETSEESTEEETSEESTEESETDAENEDTEDSSEDSESFVSLCLMSLTAASLPTTTEFPDSYKSLIEELQKNHSSWNFVAVLTGDTFENAVIREDALAGNALVAMSLGESLRSLLDRDYSAETNTWKEYEPGWAAASEDMIKWAMDPRNFLTEDNVFMFESLSYENQTEEAVQALLDNTFMEGNVPGEDYTYAWLFCWIGEKYNINPTALASRCIQEQGTTGTSELISGTYEGYENLYNYFNIGSTGSTKEQIITNGLTEAQTGSTIELPDGTTYTGSWDTPAKAIIGGSLKFANRYIERNQNTLYAQKFDYDSEYDGQYYHQYMTNITAPYTESKMVKKAYTEKNLLDLSYTFYIPVYDDMPETISAKPADRKNGNNYLRSITVNGDEVIETFSTSTTSYTYDAGEITSIDVEAVTSASTSSVSIINKSLSDTSAVYTLTVTAEDGTTRAYTLTINYSFPAVYDKTDYSSVFSISYYLSNYPEVQRNCGMDFQAALEYFVNEGILEGHQASAEFSVKIYKENYEDLRKAFGDDYAAYLNHYLTHGKSENRIASRLISSDSSSSSGSATNSGSSTSYPTVYNGVNYADVFNAAYYLNKYPDLKAAFGTDYKAALEHFVKHGIAESRQASADFSVEIYKQNYADLRKAFGNNNAAYVNHYLTYGKSENRIASKLISSDSSSSSGSGTSSGSSTSYPTVYNGVNYADVFNAVYYLNKYPDLKAAFGTDYKAALEHFVKHGIAEGRQASADFSVEIYKQNYADLRSAFGSNNAAYVNHYLTHGKSENRIASKLISSESGSSTNSASSVSYPTVYNGVDYADVFNAVYYISKYPDLKAAFGTDYKAALEHFVKHGIAEGRQASADFSVTAYKARYADLRAAFGNNNLLYVNHYITLGKKENRKGN
ncbi:MAG: N-acetylglucosaminidase [Lachnospiraceae bacterium]|jgi:hypothetical protein